MQEIIISDDKKVKCRRTSAGGGIEKKLLGAVKELIC
jgi:hypothetical protein